MTNLDAMMQGGDLIISANSLFLLTVLCDFYLSLAPTQWILKTSLAKSMLTALNKDIWTLLILSFLPTLLGHIR
ncbi:MAG: hypothetical protein GY928_11250 [Colwellia sp.]|nr:hypothetical protein [Colwellia sp.]